MTLSKPQAKRCPRCTDEDAGPTTSMCHYCTADIERASRAIVVALRDANARTDYLVGWLQRDDGSWAPVDDQGNVGQAFTFAMGDHHEYDRNAVVTIEPISIDDTEVD